MAEWIKDLQKGDLLDVLLVRHGFSHNIWLIAEVLQVSDDSINIHYCGFRSGLDEAVLTKYAININTKITPNDYYREIRIEYFRLAPLGTFTMKCERIQSDIELTSDQKVTSRPILCNNHIIFAVRDSGGSPEIVLFDIDKKD